MTHSHGRASPDNLAITPVVTELEELGKSWRRSLRAKNRSPITIRGYLHALKMLTDFLLAKGMPTSVEALSREHVEEWVIQLVDTRMPATAAHYYRSAAIFFKWCVNEGEIRESPMAHMSPPHVPDQEVETPAIAEVRKLLRGFEGRGFTARRDMAIWRRWAGAAPVGDGGMNAKVPGRQAGEAVGEKNGIQVYFGASLERALIQTARNGSLPVTLYHWLVGDERFYALDPKSGVSPARQFGYRSLLDESAFEPIH